MGFGRFWRGYDWLARADLAMGWIFDWRNWLWSLVPVGGGMTFLKAAFDGRSPLDVWIAAVVVMAALAVLVYYFLRILDRHRERSAPRPATHPPIVREALAPVAKNTTRDVTVGEAIAYLGFQEWDRGFLELASSADKAGAALYDDFLQAAADGLIPIWGKRERYAVYEPIPREYWYGHRIEWFGLLKGSAFSESSKHSSNGDRFLELMTSRAAAENFVPPGETSEIAESYPNIRAADNPSIHVQILNGADRQKFLALLGSGKLSAWARPMHGSSDFVKIPATAWETHKLQVDLHSGDSIGADGVHRVHHQSYLRKKTGTREATHYDVAFNRAQMKAVWPNLSLELDDGSGA